MRKRQIYQPASRLSPGSTPTKQNPITQASFQRLNTCSFFLPTSYKLTYPPPPHPPSPSSSPPLAWYFFVFQCKEDDAGGMRRAPLLQYFLSGEALFTRKISQLLILLAVDCGCTYSGVHLLNGLLLKLFKHSHRSPSLLQTATHSPFRIYLFIFFTKLRVREREREREREGERERGDMRERETGRDGE